MKRFMRKVPVKNQDFDYDDIYKLTDQIELQLSQQSPQRLKTTSKISDGPVNIFFEILKNQNQETVKQALESSYKDMLGRKDKFFMSIAKHGIENQLDKLSIDQLRNSIKAISELSDKIKDASETEALNNVLKKFTQYYLAKRFIACLKDENIFNADAMLLELKDSKFVIPLFEAIKDLDLKTELDDLNVNKLLIAYKTVKNFRLKLTEISDLTICQRLINELAELYFTKYNSIFGQKDSDLVRLLSFLKSLHRRNLSVEDLSEVSELYAKPIKLDQLQAICDKDSFNFKIYTIFKDFLIKYGKKFEIDELFLKQMEHIQPDIYHKHFMQNTLVELFSKKFQDITIEQSKLIKEKKALIEKREQSHDSSLPRSQSYSEESSQINFLDEQILHLTYLFNLKTIKLEKLDDFIGKIDEMKHSIKDNRFHILADQYQNYVTKEIFKLPITSSPTKTPFFRSSDSNRGKSFDSAGNNINEHSPKGNDRLISEDKEVQTPVDNSKAQLRRTSPNSNDRLISDAHLQTPVDKFKKQISPKHQERIHSPNSPAAIGF